MEYKGDGVEDLTPRAELFRSKLIEDFQLLESISQGHTEVPKYYSNELTDPSVMCAMLKQAPHAVVKLKVYSRKMEMAYSNKLDVTNEDRRLNRVKTKNAIPFGPWARMICENSGVQYFMLIVIILNSIILGIQAELAQSKDDSVLIIKLVLDILDYLFMILYVIEILLKWIDGFRSFWKNGWNNFDFAVTILSLFPELVKLFPGTGQTESLALVGDKLRVFRILRSLKMVSRFAQLRIIVLTILKAFKSMVFILILVAVFMYIFAVAGTVMFAAHSKSERADLKYRASFSTLANSLVTLFQLFTLDHWFEVMNDVSKVCHEFTVRCYVILWICIGAFIFRNIFAGIMVMNFQNIRSDFATEYKEKEQEFMDEQQGKQLEADLINHYRRNSSIRRTSIACPVKMDRINLPSEATILEEDEDGSDCSMRSAASDLQASTANDSTTAYPHPHVRVAPSGREFGSLDDTSTDQCDITDSNFIQSATWNSTVKANLHNFAINNKETLWPRDTLFRYFQLMEALQDNLAERLQLQRLAVLAINNMNDKHSDE